ncbi:hypothetical protein HX005_18720 [Acinetobacter sp. R933-2]|uniref:hypothetical protein n=1 Tax=Acinetobacter sp. R933-2 TaxID=2746728 RepID=UPI002575F7C0|nr:hypothetical protein [Acinetobacter sp. R933-2]MDM1249397.1 hypothetical protein [Acinetobacter sp. R933-2]
MNKALLIIIGIGISIIAVRCASTYHHPGRLPEGCISPIKVDPDFKIPMGPYGLPYRVGNLGGKPVMLGEEFSMAEYCDDPTITGEKGWKPYERQKHNFDSGLTSFYWEFKYTTGLILVTYREASRQSGQEYEAEQDRHDSQWVTTSVNAGTRYYDRDVHTTFLRSTIDTDIESLESLKRFHYSGVVVPTSKQVFGLDVYVAHPEWVKHWKNKDTYDIYVEKNSQGRVMTMIRCDNVPPNSTLRPRCEMKWSLEPYMNKVALRARFFRVHLKDWQLIQQQSEKILKSTVVDPKTFKFIHPYHQQTVKEQKSPQE